MIKKIYEILVIVILFPSTGISETIVENKNFKLKEIVTNLNEPWGMTFIDDNNLLITEKTGDIIQLAAILDIVSQLTRPKPAAAIPDPRTPPTIE